MDENREKKEITVDDILNEYRAMEQKENAPSPRVTPAHQVSKSGMQEEIWTFPERQQPKKAEEKAVPETHSADKRKSGRDGRGLRIGLIAVAAVCVLAVGGVFGYTYLNPTVFPGVSAGTVAVGGMTREEAEAAITQATDPVIESSAVTLQIHEKSYDVALRDVTNGIDAAASAQAAFEIGRTGNPFERVGQVFGAMFGDTQTALVVDLDQAALDARLDEIAAEALTEPVGATWEISGSNLELTMGTPGVSFDRAVVGQAVRDQIAALDFSPYTVEVQVTDPEPLDLAAIEQEIECEPTNAIVDKSDGKTIIPEKAGVQMDLEQAKEIVGDGSADHYTIPLTLTAPKVTKEVLDRALFRDTLASTSTSLNEGNAPRTNNVRLAASYMNGTILNPGDEFSYNDVVGQRTTERGFQPAGAYVAGQLVDDVGGGVCQPSSTLYMAVLRADLKVTERHNHSMTVAYTPLGEDATVNYGSLDFRFVNSTDYPIKILAEQSGGKMRVTIVGTKADDKTVKIETEVLKTKNYETVTQVDNSLKPGETSVKQSGVTGYNTVTYQVITVNGQTTKVEANRSSYAKRDKIVLTGPEAPATTETAGSTEGAAPQAASVPTSGTAQPSTEPSAPVTQDPES